jgi:UDP-galactopyranose mutase
MLENENIEVQLDVDYISIMDEIPSDIPVVYCGQVDELLNYELGVLPYRSLRFEAEWVDETEPEGADSKLGHAVINEADSDVAYTRTHFYKYYQIHEPEVLNQPKSYVVREYPADFKRGGEAYYPINNAENEELYEKYVALLTERYPNITLGGRLGAYKYWDMDKAIGFALDFADNLEI